ncbi:valine--tRNA ligase [Erysipelothrix sp. HDW6A]|uniref:valine--tRNA ligase n=1 Tax=Erysipelothrix sp. HDW6A TaxID=2714928 RepID=UPI00140B0E6B|nr:valine--tRNA ligase [Erysipelothrix sp. HDW6A]QIK57693.1 valine--tRNA ligase [Erysipelothrix sp. HDW6A]
MSKELAQKYNHKQVEEGKYRNWVEKGYFTAGDTNKTPYSIVIPPPNVTGKLHLGHAWDNTLQDIAGRYQRLLGKDVLYLPGMDHAGIATQAKVDERLREQGISRYDLGREGFLDQAWDWKEEYAGHIREQWEKLGISVDYSRERFTLDEGLNKAVNKVFVDLYNEGLIYRGYRIINWDVQAQTALSNIEVDHIEVEGAFYTFEYTVEEDGTKLAVATTRPETMFGDVCIVVHPDDERYQHLIGKHAINPANNESLPIIADSYIDIEFGTGVMKCTPAHDPNDYEIGKRHNLEMPICMNPDGTMNALAHQFEGMDRFDARKALVEYIKEQGKLISIEKHVHSVGHSERTGVIVEPYLSEQWFVKMKPLADEVLEQQKTDDPIKFYPERFNHTFTQWLENIEDWTISRQLWWGHRIPAWFHKETGETYVGLEAPQDIENWNQDEDVLDTWFSSALWPFSTLGWPENTADLERYYPTDLMVTGYDIIFFWVARMAFQGRHFTKKNPFKHVLMHGLIRDEQGRKMSKSLGNGVDPMDVIEKYGVDSLRFFLTTNSSPGQDMRYIEEKVEASWNFINKIWNASRFVKMHVGDTYYDINKAKLNQVDRYILNQFNETLVEITGNMNKYEYSLVGNTITRFAWDDFCSWYLELSKTGLQSSDEEVVYATKATLAFVLKQITIMLHPFMPFVTEEIYATLPGAGDTIMYEAWPHELEINQEGLKDVAFMIDAISKVREARVSYDVKPSKPLSAALKDSTGSNYPLTDVLASMFESMARVSLNTLEGDTLSLPIGGGSLLLLESELVDKEALIEKLNKEKIRLEGEIKRGESMLANEKFTSKAPEAKVNEERQKLEEYKRQLSVVVEQLQ